MTRNKLRLNSDKTEFMVIVSPHHQRLMDEVKPVLRLGDSVISPSKSVRNLGVTFDAQMTMQPHISNTIKTVNFHLRSLGRIRRYLDENTAAAAARALILSRLDYANSLLSGLPDVAMNRLQLAQNNTARLVTRTPPGEHITPALKRLHWLPVKQRVCHKVMCLTFQSQNSMAPAYLTNLLQKPRHTRVLRSNGETSNLVVPRTKKTIGDRAFSVWGPRRWNKLPSDVKSCGTYITFKRSLKTFLFREHFMQ